MTIIEFLEPEDHSGCFRVSIDTFKINVEQVCVFFVCLFIFEGKAVSTFI